MPCPLHATHTICWWPPLCPSCCHVPHVPTGHSQALEPAGLGPQGRCRLGSPCWPFPSSRTSQPRQTWASGHPSNNQEHTDFPLTPLLKLSLPLTASPHSPVRVPGQLEPFLAAPLASIPPQCPLSSAGRASKLVLRPREAFCLASSELWGGRGSCPLGAEPRPSVHVGGGAQEMPTGVWDQDSRSSGHHVRVQLRARGPGGQNSCPCTARGAELRDSITRCSPVLASGPLTQC